MNDSRQSDVAYRLLAHWHRESWLRSFRLAAELETRRRERGLLWT